MVEKATIHLIDIAVVNSESCSVGATTFSNKQWSVGSQTAVVTENVGPQTENVRLKTIYNQTDEIVMVKKTINLKYYTCIIR